MILLLACKAKTKHDDKKVSYFPVVSYLRGQAADIDTSLYRIIKIETYDSTTDTSYIKREEFRNYAKDFLDLPDISSKKWKDDYEESQIYDEDLKSIILSYTTNDSTKEVQKEDVMVEPQPDEHGNSQVRTIIIDKWSTTEDSTVHENMVWQTNKRFLIVKKIQKNNQPEKIRKLEVIWNDFPK